MKILMMTPSFAPRIGGVEKHVLRVSQELNRQGHRVTVLTMRWEEEWAITEEVEGVTVYRIPRQFGLKSILLRWALIRDADLIHCHDAYPLIRYYFPFRFLFPRKPLFITFHGYERYPVPREAILLRKLARRLAGGCICMGGFIEKWYGTKCDLVSCGGVDPGQPLTPAPPVGNALFVGRLETDTGIMEYLEALRLLAEQGRRLGLEVCGEGSLLPEIEEFAQEHGLDLRLHGFVSDLRPFWERARFAFVSGYLAIQEAMAAGRLVFAIYDNPLKHDYLASFPQANQVMVIAGSARELAGQLARYLDDPKLAEAKVAAATELVQGQSWARVAELYLELYRTKGKRVPCLNPK